MIDEKSDASRQLSAVAKEAFEEHALPRIAEEYPESVETFSVNITSSVAYGVADEYSDLDTFILFPDHEDYERYHEGFAELLDSIEYPDRYDEITEKGMRFELESFRKSDIESLYHDRSTRNWLEQTEWLLCWFTTANTIYDPSGTVTEFKQEVSFYPDHVVEIKAENELLRLAKYLQRMRSLHEQNAHEYVREAYFYRAVKRLMNLTYWVDRKYVPHPKWENYILTYISEPGPTLHRGIESVLTKSYSNKIEFVNDWRNRLLEAVASEYDLGERILEIAAQSGETRPDHEGEPVFFDHYRLDNRDIDSIESAFRTENPDANVLFLDETNIHRAGGADYDDVMRVQQQYVPVHLRRTDAVDRKVLRYLTFVLWRKIRVIESMIGREDELNQRWYANQVVEHLFELMFELEDVRFPPTSEQIPAAEELETFETMVDQLLASFGEPIEARVDTFWDVYEAMTQHMLASGEIDEEAVENPLDIQYDVEYWKYENLRL